MRTVTTIYAYENRIAYVSGLARLKQLKSLYLQDNEVYTMAEWSAGAAHSAIPGGCGQWTARCGR